MTMDNVFRPIEEEEDVDDNSSQLQIYGRW